VNPGSSTGIAERIARLADDSQLRQKFGAQGRLKVTSHFSFERMIENYSELYAGSTREQHAGRTVWGRA